MHLVYIDDSRDEQLCVFSALFVPATFWRAAFRDVVAFRHRIKASDGIYLRKELHAWKFVSGRGGIASATLTKARRCEIFLEAMDAIMTLPGVGVMNAVFPAKEDERAFERLLNRINRTVEARGSLALTICDEGKEARAPARLQEQVWAPQGVRAARSCAAASGIPQRLGRDHSPLTK